jgi:glycosyltransferase involved in cell wall biosynthesis
MKILIFTQQLASFRSGVGTYTHNLVKVLSAIGHDVSTVVPTTEKTDKLAAKIFSVSRFKLDPSPGGWLSLGYSFAKTLRLYGTRYDIAHFTDAREAWLVRNPAVPMVGMINDTYALDWVGSGYPRHAYADRSKRSLYYYLQRIIERHTYRKFPVVLANSLYTKQKIIQGYGLPARRVKTVYYGLSSPSPSDPKEIKGEPSIIFVGGNFQRKGLPTLIEAVSVQKEFLPNICLHVIGEDRNQQALENQSLRFDVQNNIIFHGRKANEEVKRMMAGADIFAMPSLTEGFGLVYAEAMQAGIPVIATMEGGLKEVMKNKEEALFVKPGDPHELAAAIQSLVSDGELRARLKRKGKSAVERLDVKKMGKETEAIYLELLRKKSASALAAL